MNDPRFRRLSALCALLAAMALHGCVQGSRSDAADAATNGDAPAMASVDIVRRKEIYDFSEKLAVVRVENPYGDLRVRMSDRNSLGVSAVIQRLGEHPRDPELVVERSSGHIALAIRYAGDEAAAAHDLHRGRVDLVVFVPREASLDMATDAGRLEVRHASGPVRARSRSGAIAVTSREAIDAASDTGLVMAGQLRAGWTGDSTIRSARGAVQLSLPTKGDVGVVARAGGGISAGPGWNAADLDLPTGSPHEWQYTRGSGLPVVRVETDSTLMIEPVIILPPG